MDKICQLGWNNIPRHIIINIASHLPLLFQVELRLISKHWMNALNTLVFQSIENFNPSNLPLTLKNNGSYVKTVSCPIVNNLDTSDLKTSFPNLLNLKIHLIHSNFNKLLDLIKGLTNLEKLEVYSHLKLGRLKESVPNDITSTINALTTLNSLNFSLLHPFNSPFPQFSLLNLDSLQVRFNYSDFERFREEFKKLTKLRHFKVIISYYGYRASSDEEIKLLAPGRLLIHNGLKTLSFRNHSYSVNNQTSTSNYLTQEFFKLFTNPLFFNLNSFEWKLTWSSQRLSQPIFTQALPDTQIWTNLIRICLSNVDEYLLTYIVEHCPNLVELVTNSPLALPNCGDSTELKPLKKLKRLRITGFDKKLIDNEALISRIFPNIETLDASFQYGTNASNQAIFDAYYIPLLFPNLKFLILENDKYELRKLVNDYSNDLGWVELFIYITATNIDLFSLLMNKMPNIRLIYLNKMEMDNLNNFKERGIRLFNATIDESSYFNPNINFELK
jgi:hypothetical protein